MAQAAYQIMDKGCVCILVRLMAKIFLDNVEKSSAKKLGCTDQKDHPLVLKGLDKSLQTSMNIGAGKVIKESRP